MGHVLRRALVAGMLAATGLALPTAHAVGPCSTPGGAGGEWPTFGHDDANTRHQDQETDLGPGRAAQLAAAWTFSLAGVGESGDFNNTPAVADGCLFLASDTGVVLALDAQSGQVAWRTTLPGAILGSLTVADGRVFLTTNQVKGTLFDGGPYAYALDEGTGHELWSTRFDDNDLADSYSTPVVFNGMVFVGVSAAGAEGGTTFYGNPQARLGFRGSYVFLDEGTGQIIAKRYVIPDADFQAGYAGGGVWSTAAVDRSRGYAYVGTGNPFNSDEHEHTNSILKIDVDRTRPMFGDIVAAYHGLDDQYVPLRQKPVCDVYVDVFTCNALDLDFGASPQLFSDAAGRALVGDLQKSGVYHAVDAATMTGVWTATLGGPPPLVVALGNSGTASFDGAALSVGGSGPGMMASLARDNGALRWVSPTADGIHIEPVTTADGVTYTVDARGVFRAWNSATGDAVFTRPLALDTGQYSTVSGSSAYGVVVALHTVYVPAPGGFLVAYRVPSG